MKIGLVLSVYNNVSLDEALRRAADAGYEAVELGVEHHGGQLDLDELLLGNNAGKLRKQIADYGLIISALGNHAEGQLVLGPYHSDTDVVYAGTPAEKLRYGVDRVKKTAQLAHELEVPIVTGFCGCEDYSRWFPWPDENAWDKTAPVFVERWSDLLDTFAKYGVKFAHECHPRQFAYNTETAELTVDLLKGRPEWGFNLDPANLLLAGVDPVVFIQRLGDRILHVHAKDGELVAHNAARSGLLAHGAWDRRDRGFRFRIPGWGDVRWKAVLTELRLVGYDYVLAVEHEDPTMSREDGVEKAIDFLKPLLIQKPFEGRWW